MSSLPLVLWNLESAFLRTCGVHQIIDMHSKGIIRNNKIYCKNKWPRIKNNENLWAFYNRVTQKRIQNLSFFMRISRLLESYVMLFHEITFCPVPRKLLEHEVLHLAVLAVRSNLLGGNRQMLMQWKKHVKSLFLHLSSRACNWKLSPQTP